MSHVPKNRRVHSDYDYLDRARGVVRWGKIMKFAQLIHRSRLPEIELEKYIIQESARLKKL